jgi:hypothetical protein
MNIIGEGFNTEILGQINQRQKIYGAAYRTNQILSYLNSRTGWCKLVSGAEVITEPRPGLKLPEAKKYVLFNGMVDEGKSLGSGGRAGISRTNSVETNTAYGLGGLQLGERPMPGIISADIKTETRGSLKTANVKIKAWNTTQFDIIDVLYLRLGYSLLLEWGHSSYYNNDGAYIPDNPHSIADTFLGDSLDYDGILQLIQKKRLESNGNYDAMLGKVTNFTWKFNPDGSYDIDLKLIGLGDVIEALKLIYPQHNICYSPEFLRAATSAKDFAEQKFMIIGGEDPEGFWQETFSSVLPNCKLFFQCGKLVILQH